MLFGLIITKCHLQLESSGCWIALTFFPPFAAQAGKDSSWRGPAARGTGRTGNVPYVLICLHSSLGICQNRCLQTSHILRKSSLWWLGHNLPLLLSTVSSCVMGMMTLAFSEVLLLPSCWLMMIVPYSHIVKQSHFQENVSPCKLVHKLFSNINIVKKDASILSCAMLALSEIASSTRAKLWEKHTLWKRSFGARKPMKNSYTQS